MGGYNRSLIAVYYKAAEMMILTYGLSVVGWGVEKVHLKGSQGTRLGSSRVGETI